MRIFRDKDLVINSKIGWLLYFFFLIHSSCQTHHDSFPSETKAESNDIISSHQKNVAECPQEVPICTKEHVPVLCTAFMYYGKKIPPEDRLTSWGSNFCVGMFKLRELACSQGLTPSRIGEIHCVPDASNGNCPIKDWECPETGSQVICTFEEYENQKINEGSKISAVEKNECLAKRKLQMEACRSNLDPLKMKFFSCKRMQTDHSKKI